MFGNFEFSLRPKIVLARPRGRDFDRRQQDNPSRASAKQHQPQPIMDPVKKSFFVEA